LFYLTIFGETNRDFGMFISFILGVCYNYWNVV